MKKTLSTVPVLFLLFGYTLLVGQINVPQYMPLHPGDIYTYNDSSQMVIAGTRYIELFKTLTWEIVWTPTPSNPDRAERDYYILRGDSLFWAAHVYWDDPEHNDMLQFYPPVPLGTANTSSGQQFAVTTTVHNLVSGTSDEVIALSVKVETVSAQSVPAGTYNDCIKISISLEGELFQTFILARNVGMIQVDDFDESTPSGETPPLLVSRTEGGATVNILEYFPLAQGWWSYADGSELTANGLKKMAFCNDSLYELVWTVIPDTLIGNNNSREYYLARGDSLFFVASFMNEKGWSNPEYFAIDPPILLGTSAAPLGRMIQSSSIILDIPTGVWAEDTMMIECLIVPAGKVSAGGREYENCVRMYIYFNEWRAGEKWFLAPGVGRIMERYKDDMSYQPLVAFNAEGEPIQQTKGDINQDKKVNIFDLLELLKAISGKTTPTSACDVNEDGKVNIFDLLDLLKLL